MGVKNSRSGNRIHDQRVEADRRVDLTLFAEIAGESVGFILTVRDINVVLQKLNGRLTWFGF
jgi:hypothetical protein